MTVMISVIVCTYNRADYLSKCLQSLVNQTLNKDFFEVLVINNNSTDNTQEIAASFSDKILNFRIILETKQGLSHARNRGWKESQGKYIAFIDDDAIAKPEWLSEIVSTFFLVKPEPDACGGRVELLWESPRPVWMPDLLLTYLGNFDYGPTEFFIKNLRTNLSGSNVAFKKGVSEKVGLFNCSLGRQKSNLLSAEEVELFQRMYNLGLKIYYNPAIVVKHHVTKERTEKKWHLTRCYWEGQSKAIRDLQQDPELTSNLIKIGTHFYLMVIIFLFSIICLNDQRRFRAKCHTQYYIGYIIRQLSKKRVSTN